MFRPTRPRFFVAICLIIVVAALPGFSRAQQPAPRPISLLGQVGGNSSAIAVRGDRAYLGVGPRLYVLDISDRTNPRLVTRTPNLNAAINGITIDGSLAYVAAGDKGVLTYDLSAPDSLRLVSTFDTPGAASDIFVGDGLAYIADVSGGLRIVDVSQPARPTELNVIPTSESVWGVTVDGNRVFVANGRDGLKIYDATDRVRLNEIGSAGIGDSYDVVVSGTYAYVADYYGLRTFDFSDLSDINETDIFYTSYMTLSVAMSGGFVYVTDNSLTGLHAFDLADPAHPELARSIPTRIGGLQVATDGNFAYLAQDSLGLAIFDISNPREPRQVGQYIDVGGIQRYTTASQHVIVESGYAYANVSLRRLSVIDVRNPVSPREVAAIDLECCINQHILYDRYLYVFVQGGMRIYDISTPTQPQEVGRETFGGSTTAVTIRGTTMYAAYADNTFRVIDLTVPSEPRQTGSLPIVLYQPSHVVVYDQYAYVFTAFDISIFNISDSANPVFEGSFRDVNIISDVVMQGPYIYAATREGFVIFDATQPRNITIATSYVFDLEPGYSILADGIAVQDDRLYLASYGGLYIFDVADRTAPVLTHQRLTSSYNGVAVEGSAIFATSRGRGLETLMVLDGPRIYLPSISR